MKVRTEHHGGSDISSGVAFQGAEVRKPMLAVSGVTDKGNIVIFDGSGSLKLPGQSLVCGLCKKGCHRGSRTHPAACG